MKSFADWLFEKLEVPNHTDGFKKQRHTMPQIHDFDAFCTDIKAAGQTIGDGEYDAEALIPTQGNFNEEKVNAMVENGTWSDKPIIVSRDLCVIDGHHRWLAAAKAKKKIKARVVDMDAEQMLEFCKDKPYCEKRGINQ